MFYELDEDVIREFSSKTLSGGQRHILRIVSINNKSPVLEKRKMFLNENEEWQYGRLAGLNKDDLEVIQDNIEEIINYLKA